MFQHPTKGGWIQVFVLEGLFGRLFGNVVFVCGIVIDFELDDNLVARSIGIVVGGVVVVVVNVVSGKFVAGIIVVVDITSAVFVLLLVFLETHNPPVKFSSNHALALFCLFIIIVVVVVVLTFLQL